MLGTQATIRLAPKAQDTRVLSVMLLLRQLHEEKMSTTGAPAMHVVGENQGNKHENILYFFYCHLFFSVCFCIHVLLRWYNDTLLVNFGTEDMTATLALGPRRYDIDASLYREPDFVNTQAR